MNYRGKRNRANLSIYTVARELGIDYDTYLEVDRGLRQLEGEMLDKFNSTIDNAREINFNRMEKMKIVNEKLKSGELKRKAYNMGYTIAELGRAVRMNEPVVNNIINGHDKYSEDKKEIVYDFLNNPLNKKIDNGVKKKESVKKPLIEQKNITEPVIKEEDIIEPLKKENVGIEVKKVEDDIIDDKLKEFNLDRDSLFKENQRLKRQLYLYEKLIEKL